MDELLIEWTKVAARIESAIAGLDPQALDRRGGQHGWSVRETVHHLVEANLVASNMILAALAVDGYEFDWTWVNPDAAWMRRVGYDHADPAPAIAMLHAITAHMRELLGGRADVAARRVTVRDAPGKPTYTLTIEEIVRHEVEHVGDHLSDVLPA